SWGAAQHRAHAPARPGPHLCPLDDSRPTHCPDRPAGAVACQQWESLRAGVAIGIASSARWSSPPLRASPLRLWQAAGEKLLLPFGLRLCLTLALPGAQASHTADALVVANAQCLARGLPTKAANGGVELRPTPLADRLATLRANLGEEFRP